MTDPFSFAKDLAINTGDLLQEYFQVSGISSQLKADRTVVTEADLAADKFIQSEIASHFPGDYVLSEEKSTIYPGNEQPTWIIDPLDGTTNFSLGLHYWGVSIARIQNSVPDIAAVYFPMIDELFSAKRGSGAWLNDAELPFKSFDEPDTSSFFSCCSRTFKHYDVGIRYKARILGAAAFGLCSVPRGTAMISFEATPKIWDIAGAWLIIEETGTLIQPQTGNSPFPLEPGTDYQGISFPSLAAKNAKEMKIALENIQLKTT